MVQLPHHLLLARHVRRVPTLPDFLRPQVLRHGSCQLVADSSGGGDGSRRSRHKAAQREGGEREGGEVAAADGKK